jgi:hypothetical protein
LFIELGCYSFYVAYYVFFKFDELIAYYCEKPSPVLLKLAAYVKVAYRMFYDSEIASFVK